MNANVNAVCRARCRGPPAWASPQPGGRAWRLACGGAGLCVIYTYIICILGLVNEFVAFLSVGSVRHTHTTYYSCILPLRHHSERRQTKKSPLKPELLRVFRRSTHLSSGTTRLHRRRKAHESTGAKRVALQTTLGWCPWRNLRDVTVHKEVHSAALPK